MTSDKIQDRALRALSEFDAVSMFSKCGLALESSTAVHVQSWDDALENLGGLEWENAGIDVANLLRDQIRARFPGQVNFWNHRVRDIKPQTEVVASKKLTPWIQTRTVPQVVVNSVRWDFLHLCIYEGHKPSVGIPFYEEMKGWYLAGHLPCGWHGDFPRGQMMVH